LLVDTGVGVNTGVEAGTVVAAGMFATTKVPAFIFAQGALKMTAAELLLSVMVTVPAVMLTVIASSSASTPVWFALKGVLRIFPLMPYCFSSGSRTLWRAATASGILAATLFKSPRPGFVYRLSRSAPLTALLSTMVVNGVMLVMPLSVAIE
jgi:hypothetical protein